MTILSAVATAFAAIESQGAPRDIIHIKYTEKDIRMDGTVTQTVASRNTIRVVALNIVRNYGGSPQANAVEIVVRGNQFTEALHPDDQFDVDGEIWDLLSFEYIPPGDVYFMKVTRA